MKIKITEEQFKKLIGEDYPIQFSFDEFKNIKSYRGKMQYCDMHLQKIASGSARIVYKVDEQKVLKLAKNKKGIAQNEEEARSYAIETEIGAAVFEHDDEYFWIEMELAKKCKPSDFKRILGFDFKFIQEYITYVANQYSRRYIAYDKRYDEYFAQIDNEEINNWEWFNALYDYMANTRLQAIGDLRRISSWGIVTRNGNEEIVLIDFGLTDEVYSDYYSRR